ncbi:hypothetical protein EKG40_20590 [Pseudomonas moorei]|nr:hypothetical protein EKG40_20590 [Pseudomonas moorei]
MLAMEANDDATGLGKRGAIEIIASGLAPTGIKALFFFRPALSLRCRARRRIATTTPPPHRDNG